MSLPKIKFIFNRRKNATLLKPSMVELEIYFLKKRKYRSTGIEVLKSEWDPVKKIVNRDDAFLLNLRLDKFKKKYDDFVASLIIKDIPFSFEALDEFDYKEKLEGSFVEFVEERINKRRDIRESTKHSHRRILGALKSFKKLQFFSTINKTNIKVFDQWLHERYSKQTTIHCYHKILKVYINMALDRGFIEEDPYRGVKIDKGQPQNKKYLTEEELQNVIDIKVFDDSVMRCRDLFLFQCFTGLAYADLNKFDFNNIIEKNGKFILKDKRKKTGIEYFIVLLKPAVEILERYNFKLPLISNQKYNSMLKTVAAYAGIKDRLTSHCGRHTYATWCLNQGVPLETLKIMLGHSSIKSTAIYAKILNKTVEDAFERLEQRI